MSSGDTITFGSLRTTHETLSRVIPSPFSTLRPLPSVVSNSKTRAAQTTRPTRMREHTFALDQPLYFGEHRVHRYERCFSDESTALRDWTSPLADTRRVPFAHVLHALSRRRAASLPASACLAPRGLHNMANECFANAVLQMFVHCEPLRLWCERVEVNFVCFCTRLRSCSIVVFHII